MTDAAAIRAYHDLAVTLARDAGGLILSAFYDTKRISIKSNILDIVTDTDKQAEQLIIAAIRQRYPHHRFIAEESHATAGRYDLHDDPTWVIDPVDGTNNFVHALPFVCVSIGVMINKHIVAAVVHAPVLGETFTAIRGQGAFLTNHPVYTDAGSSASSAPSSSSSSSVLPSSSSQRLSASSITSISSAAILTELGYDRSALGISLQLERLRLLTTSHSMQSLRSFGSCALNLCYVAAGRAEAYYEGRDAMVGPKPWDSSAGWLIVTEAGGVLLDMTGDAFDMTNGRILAANGTKLAQQLVAVFKEADANVRARGADSSSK